MTRDVLNRPVDVAGIPAAGVVERLEATGAERAAIAEAFGLVEVTSLEAELDVRRMTGGLIVIEGSVAAKIVQTCVVSLEPVVQSIDEPVSVRYTTAAPPALRSGAEVLVDIQSEPPEAISGPTIDLGAVVLEHFALAIDPYPRAPGAELPERSDEGSDVPESPFAVLSALGRGKN